jgi:serine/threonine protein kinase
MTSSDEIRVALEHAEKFVIHEQIAEGANAVAVFRAFDRLLQREVFLKVMYYSPDFAADLLHEPRVLVQATQAIPKPENLVQVFAADILTVGGEQYLCLQTEWIQGASLLSSLSENLGQFDALRIASGILHGVSHLHSRRILHRDLKPANILMDGVTAKIADFGSAAVLPQGARSVPASRHSALYVPPEAWGPQPQYSIASDVYQVGMVLYELVNGAFQYELRHYLTPKVLKDLHSSGRDFQSLDACDQSQQADRGIAELSAKGRLLMQGRPPRLYYSGRISRVVNKATNADPTRRFQSATEFLAKLNRIDIPNWRQVDGNNFLAENWKGWDWSVALSASGTLLRKAKPGTNKFRRVNALVASPVEAFSYVEQH